MSPPTLQPMEAEGCAPAEIRPRCFGNAGVGKGRLRGSGMTYDLKNRETRRVAESGAAHGCGYLLWNSRVPTLVCFWNTIVCCFGTLPSSLCVFLSPFLHSFSPRRPQCSRLYLSLLWSARVIPLRHSTLFFFFFYNCPKNTIIVSAGLYHFEPFIFFFFFSHVGRPSE